MGPRGRTKLRDTWSHPQTASSNRSASRATRSAILNAIDGSPAAADWESGAPGAVTCRLRRPADTLNCALALAGGMRAHPAGIVDMIGCHRHYLLLTVEYLMILLHYGLQRSGTNYLEALFKTTFGLRFSNSNADRSSPLQKHFRLYGNKDIVPEPQYRNDITIGSFSQFEALFPVRPDFYVVISKDPYSWYLSYTAWADKCRWPAPNHHYIEEYNLFYGKFQELASQTDNILFVRYADLLGDREAALAGLERRMGLKRRERRFFIRRSLRRVPQSADFSEEQRDYYLKKGYLARLGRDALRQLNERLDPQVTRLLGYEIVPAS